jgi:hypothetical protein
MGAQITLDGSQDFRFVVNGEDDGSLFAHFTR